MTIDTTQLESKIGGGDGRGGRDGRICGAVFGDATGGKLARTPGTRHSNHHAGNPIRPAEVALAKILDIGGEHLA